MRLKNRKLAFAVLAGLLVIAVCYAICTGSVSMPVSELINGLFSKKGGSIGIIRDIRIPRVIMALLVGCNLAVAGVLLQGVMRNPLADPGITGISSGASVVVIFVMLYLPGMSHLTPLFGFIGSMIACTMIYLLAWKKGISAMRIVLAGVAVNTMLGGVTSMLSILNSDKLAGVLSWLNGNIGNKSWSDIRTMCIYTVIGIICAIPMATYCNLLALGDKNAKSLGHNPNLLRILISLVAVFLAGISTAYVGVIGFIGLIVPHIGRMLIGSDHKILLPFSAMLGALVLVIADTVGRTIASPYEIPVGVMMAVLGAPFFLYLLRKGGNHYGND